MGVAEGQWGKAGGELAQLDGQSLGPYPAYNWIEVLHFHPGDMEKEGLLLPLFRYLSAFGTLDTIKRFLCDIV